jgi:hypothetical protein
MAATGPEADTEMDVAKARTTPLSGIRGRNGRSLLRAISVDQRKHEAAQKWTSEEANDHAAHENLKIAAFDSSYRASDEPRVVQTRREPGLRSGGTV